jgi:PIN domain nuclease of toxin-antitoxin system
MQGNRKYISRDASELLDEAQLLISPMVMLEVEYMYELRRTKLRWPAVEAKVVPEIGLTICTLPFPTVSRLAIDESWTRDPFDRMIVAHAKANGFAYLISSDQDIARNYPRTVW